MTPNSKKDTPMTPLKDQEYIAHPFRSQLIKLLNSDKNNTVRFLALVHRFWNEKLKHGENDIEAFINQCEEEYAKKWETLPQESKDYQIRVNTVEPSHTAVEGVSANVKVTPTIELLDKLMTENANLKDTVQRRNEWVIQAKRDAGYDRNISFDIVWADALKALKSLPKLDAADKKECAGCGRHVNHCVCP